MTREDTLISRMARGDPEAAGELVELYYPEILRYCRWHVPNPSLAEDAAQETFLKAIRFFDRYTHRGKFRPFLYRIAANTCIDLARRQTGEVSLEELTAESASQGRELEAVQGELALQQMVRALPKEQREVVLLRFSQDLTLREIAGVLDLPLRTVQSRLRAALKKLKQEYEEGGI